jgi:hypothetical protein
MGEILPEAEWPAVVTIGQGNTVHVVPIEKWVGGAVVGEEVAVASETLARLQQSSFVKLYSHGVENAHCGAGDFAHPLSTCRSLREMVIPSIFHLLLFLTSYVIFPLTNCIKKVPNMS